MLLALKAATGPIPIVFGTGSDPVQTGLVASLGRPAGNATGMHVFVTGLIPKRLELLREVLPQPGPVASRRERQPFQILGGYRTALSLAGEARKVACLDPVPAEQLEPVVVVRLLPPLVRPGPGSLA